MGTKDKRIDAYISKSSGFAKPILTHLRKIVHTSCPDVEETMKWSFPHFEYNGKILYSMASFKQHCAFGFWKASLLSDSKGVLSRVGKTAMGHMGRITSLGDLPSDKILIDYLKEAARLNKEGIKSPPKPESTQKKELKVPDYFMKALKKNSRALSTFENFSYSNKKDYVEWVTEAKTEDTRAKRLETAIIWMAEGKVRNWKYIKK